MPLPPPQLDGPVEDVLALLLPLLLPPTPPAPLPPPPQLDAQVEDVLAQLVEEAAVECEVEALSEVEDLLGSDELEDLLNDADLDLDLDL